MDQTLNISVIVCAYTEKRWEDQLSAVASLKAQTLQPDEIILSIDHNPALFERTRIAFPDLVVVENTEQRGLSGARNSAIAVATGQVIAFMDEDAIAEPEWLANLATGFSTNNILGVGGAILPRWVAPQPDWFPEEFNWVVGCTYLGMPETTSAVRNLIGCNMAFRKEVFDQAGGFRSEIGRVGTYPAGCEETELCIRSKQVNPNGVFIYEPAARVHHRVPDVRTKFAYFTSRCYAEGLSKALVSQLVGSQAGLSSERSYTFRTLPLGFFKGLGNAIFRRQFAGIKRAAAIFIGLAYTTAGYINGRAMLLKNRNKAIATPNLSMDQA